MGSSNLHYLLKFYKLSSLHENVGEQQRKTCVPPICFKRKEEANGFVELTHSADFFFSFYL
jgi:hypothetical protein